MSGMDDDSEPSWGDLIHFRRRYVLGSPELAALLDDADLKFTPRQWLPDPDDVYRRWYGIPRGFPLWYRSELPALPIGPIGRAQLAALHRPTNPFLPPVFQMIDTPTAWKWLL